MDSKRFAKPSVIRLVPTVTRATPKTETRMVCLRSGCEAPRVVAWWMWCVDNHVPTRNKAVPAMMESAITAPNFISNTKPQTFGPLDPQTVSEVKHTADFISQKQPYGCLSRSGWFHNLIPRREWLTRGVKPLFSLTGKRGGFAYTSPHFRG